MCTPALRALHRRFPAARITVAGRNVACAALRGLPYLSGEIALPAKPGILRMMALSTRLHRAGADLTVVFPHSFRAALLAYIARSRQRLGYDRGGRRRLLTDALEPHKSGDAIQPIYMAREYLELVAHLGCKDDEKGLELRAEPEAAAAIRTRLEGDGPLVGLAPGAAFGPSKRWLPERYAQVADRLHDALGARCVLLTGPDEEDTREAVVAATHTGFRVADGGHPTIDTVKATISQLDLLICNDSGTRHVAIAFGVPVLCIMGPTSPDYSTGPYERGEVLRVQVPCGPCQKTVCETDHRCMTKITASQVFEAASRLLGA